jgi:HSP20 family protein
MNIPARPVAVAIGLGRPCAETSSTNGNGHARQTPHIDIHDGPDGLVLEADLPGAAESTLAVQVEDNVLSLRAPVPSNLPDGARTLHEESHPGEYYRSFILSEEVDRGRISAELKNGVLRLSLPKAQRAVTRRIEIKTPTA